MASWIVHLPHFLKAGMGAHIAIDIGIGDADIAYITRERKEELC